MSIKYMTKVWQLQELEPNQKLVFLAICDNANDEGICYRLLILYKLKQVFQDQQ